jgi:ubiquinone/menaquinone biosynthesis C-methylase UbiE
MSFVRTKDQESEIPRELYFGDTYFAPAQLYSLSQQLHEVHSFKPTSVLEIGKGNGFVSEFLKKSGIRVVTVDVNPSLEPDYILDIRDLHSIFAENEFDCTLCAEVLEHLPYNDLDALVHQISRLSRIGAVITLPRADRIIASIDIRLKLPKLKERTIYFAKTLPMSKRRIYDGHHWEINHTAGTALKNVRSCFLKHFTSCQDYRYKLNPYHHYFSLTR